MVTLQLLVYVLEPERDICAVHNTRHVEQAIVYAYVYVFLNGEKPPGRVFNTDILYSSSIPVDWSPNPLFPLLYSKDGVNLFTAFGPVTEIISVRPMEL